MRLKGEGGSTYSWKLDGVQKGTASWVYLSGISLGSHTVTLNDTVSCAFTVEAHTAEDKTAAIAAIGSTLMDKLLLYDADGTDVIDAADITYIKNNP